MSRLSHHRKITQVDRLITTLYNHNQQTIAPTNNHTRRLSHHLTTTPAGYRTIGQSHLQAITQSVHHTIRATTPADYRTSYLAGPRPDLEEQHDERVYVDRNGEKNNRQGLPPGTKNGAGHGHRGGGTWSKQQAAAAAAAGNPKSLTPEHARGPKNIPSI